MQRSINYKFLEQRFGNVNAIAVAIDYHLLNRIKQGAVLNDVNDKFFSRGIVRNYVVLTFAAATSHALACVIFTFATFGCNS